MKPKKLILCGWGPYKSIEQVDFSVFEEKGVFLITGATGAGKTTIFDAISYALYGALSGEERDRERNSSRSDFADAETSTYVELWMEHKGELYHIRRNPEYLRPKKRSGAKAAYTKEKENAVLTYPDGRVLEGVREVNAALKDLLVLDYRQFKKISMIAQGEFARLLVAPPKEKTAIFREIFGTGIFERFAQELGIRARAAYAKVAEQKAKLEEDVRILCADGDKSQWSDPLNEEFKALTKADNWNYPALLECMAKMQELAKEKIALLKKDYVKMDGQLEKLTAELAILEKENAQVLRLMQVKRDLENLQLKRGEYEEKQERYTRAMNAGWAEGAQNNVLQLQKQLEANKRQRLIELAKRMEQEIQKLEEYRQMYVKQEISCKEVRDSYEEAKLRRRMDAVGLAASLLEEGKPCPVCGSIEHPAPAVSGEEILSEEKLKELKAVVVKEEEKLNALHGKTIMQKTRMESLQEQDAELKHQEETLILQLEEATRAFEQALKQYGFPDEDSYYAARLDKEKREALGRDLESFRTKLATTEELFGHLQETVSRKEPVDLTKLQEELKEIRQKREAFMKELKLWEHRREDVKKTQKQVEEKLHIITRESDEYGYIKDLENLASGNNSKRLVFEQYVLAGYFEEILRAANIRFAKMTGGRYEMSRVQQVGDGRVKDNLEIEVLDYYTGKYRSVRTLSGGESFKASLSLALGMSDVIQAMNGGIRVDTLFVDEGFGSLDEESLDQACSTLMSLAEKKHLIGIISHVPELRERIENQLLVEKTGAGSRIKVQ